MVLMVKFTDLTPTAILSIVLKVLSIFCMILTIFLPILVVNFTGSGLNAFITFFSFNATLFIKQGSSNALPTQFSTNLLNIMFILTVLGIVVTVILLFIHKNRYASIVNAFSIIVLFVLFLNYYLVTTLNGHTLSGIVVTVSENSGFSMLIVSLIFLFISSFTKFNVKDNSIVSNS